MKSLGLETTDKAEAFVAYIDSYELRILKAHGDTFRMFARFISRSIDSRYLERHAPQELLPDLEDLLQTCFSRAQDHVIVQLTMGGDAANKRAVLITCMPDQHFIYSIVKQALDKLGIKMYRNINSVMPIARDASGHIVSVGSPEAPRESLIWVELDADNIGDKKDAIENYLRGRLEAARTVVEDFSKLTNTVQCMAACYEDLAKAHAQHVYSDCAKLLRWLLNEHFVFLGTRFFVKPQQAAQPTWLGDFGIGRLHDFCGIQFDKSERDLQDIEHIPATIRLRKSHTESWIYRPGRTDHILVPYINHDEQIIGLLVIEGIFNYPALSEPRTSIPLLERVVSRLYDHFKASKGSHRYRAIRNAFNSLPLEYLFSLPEQDVFELVEQVLDADAEHRSQIHITQDPNEEIAFVFIALPRANYSEEVRGSIRRLLTERFAASAIDDGVYAGNSESVTFHYFLTGTAQLDKAAQAILRTDIDQIASPWSEKLNNELIMRHGIKQARHLYALYSEAFPRRYREETSIARAIEDIGILETIGIDNTFDCDLYREKIDQSMGITRLRMFQTDAILLSDILPILDNFGLIVIDQFPTSIHLPTRAENAIATFRIRGVAGMQVDLVTRRSRLCNAIRAVVMGAMSNDPLNRLLLRADIPWTSVVLMLAYQAYANQLGQPFGQSIIQETLLAHADIVRSLTEFFRAKFDPDIEGQHATNVDQKRLQLVERSKRAVLIQLDAIEDLTSDQVLRTLYNLIDATVRTNFYSRDSTSDYHIVLKFDPQHISRMPEPRPFREIYVHHPQVAGLHLRGGPIARGGIRWSDRLIDYRTEVLGLMHTQNLKNVLIVPRGAKGAFVLRHPPADMATRRAFADDMYKIFIRGLLEVTDNLVGGVPQTPAGVLRYDDHDHYLVVAADKGTAHLSDTANQIAADKDFWLGDAFASGGSQGYDHKKEAITSRGAWACVKRHFAEIGIDPEKDAIRTVGIGDMSGDVFGNGMLRSASIQLVAAFDHRHIFLDPHPDAKQSFAARYKLFNMPRSSWENYPTELISHGGGVFPRSAKSIKISPEVADVLGIRATSLSAPELIQAILCAPVDLLWNGGIGTYIKASTETHLQIGDTVNDGVRVDGLAVRAKVIGEGGNLGISSLGRIELAAHGVRLNTDAIDNSAGVDLSDHEVNLKILFFNAQQRGAMQRAQRNTLLETLRVEIGESVVDNNWLQSRMISLDDLRSRRDLPRFERAIAFLAKRVPFRIRESELPDERTMRARAQKGEGLYRPELAVIASNAKLDLRQELTLADAEFSLDKMQEYLFAYFPTSIIEQFSEDIRQHPLAKNIARTVLTNIIIADTGISWLPEMTLMTGCTAAAILDAYLTASNILHVKAIKSQIDRLSTHINCQTEYALRIGIEDALEITATFLLQTKQPLQHDFVANVQQAIALIPPPQDKIYVDMPHDLETVGHAFLRIEDILDIAELACRIKKPVQYALELFYNIGASSGLQELIRRSAVQLSNDEMDKPARLALRCKLRRQLIALIEQTLPSNDMACSEHIRKELAMFDASHLSVAHLVMATEWVQRYLSVLL